MCSSDLVARTLQLRQSMTSRLTEALHEFCGALDELESAIMQELFLRQIATEVSRPLRLGESHALWKRARGSRSHAPAGEAVPPLALQIRFAQMRARRAMNRLTKARAGVAAALGQLRRAA